jgi:hypothetical protein
MMELDQGRSVALMAASDGGAMIVWSQPVH